MKIYYHNDADGIGAAIIMQHSMSIEGELESVKYDDYG